MVAPAGSETILTCSVFARSTSVPGEGNIYDLNGSTLILPSERDVATEYAFFTGYPVSGRIFRGLPGCTRVPGCQGSGEVQSKAETK